MKVPLSALLLATAFATGNAFAAAPAAPPADAPAADDHRALERKLEDARVRLERAAKEVAELSAGLVPDSETMQRIVGSHVHPMLGVQLGAPGAGGVSVVSVSPGGAAAQAGLAAGDVIISVNGQHVANATDVASEVRRVPPGAEARIERSRNGKTATLVAEPRAMDPRLTVLLDDEGHGFADFGAGMGEMMQQVMPGFGGGWGELELAAVSPELGRYFGTDKGVLIIKAPAAFGDKLKDGDVILSIGGREPLGVAHALRILHSYQPLEHVSLALERDHKPLKLDFTMPERRHGEPRMQRVAPMRGAPPAPPAPPSPSAAPPPPAPQGAMPPGDGVA